ncbi:hypothetical protein LJC52_02870 [Bacteroidales bacterium OttesenSCG-928-A17]|nr:hypothetical protein [Bacteroidales bacterium OttesenSCG-928-A17]
MAIVIKEIKVVTTVEKNRIPHLELNSELVKSIRKICHEEKVRLQTEEKRRER